MQWWQVRNALATTESKANRMENSIMLWTLAVIRLALWVLGIVSSHVMGGFIHILLVIAVVVVLVNVIQGRRAV
ncbi:MAG: hypothetical protein AUJ92_15905 [Armatimonadetes bacterium CG2_30_59_28]|nr:MAG: hypothetical protein AUJ92_15905 [Armatimonadetes bacterium CG2_30_59_28]PIU63554.1 MAG: hypothetical protein COS85_15750 [Armatimonadetes bacterium CG07_land_8_20_14_0_80_59_28]